MSAFEKCRQEVYENFTVAMNEEKSTFQRDSSPKRTSKLPSTLFRRLTSAKPLSYELKVLLLVRNVVKLKLKTLEGDKSELLTTY